MSELWAAMPRRVHWIVAVLLYSLSASLCFVGCARRTPELIAVSRVSPDRLAERDVMTISGEGFVVGAEALVKFSGTVYRPAQPARKVNVEQRALAVDAENVELQATPEFIAQFCGNQATADGGHATFRGELRVSFVPRLQGAPPIEGKTQNVVLDLFRGQSGTAAINSSKVVAGQAMLGFLGLSVVELGEQGLRVVDVLPGKPAFEAGIRSEDRIVSWGNLRVHRRYDLEPFPGQRLVDVKLRRESVATEFPLVVPVEGYAPQSAHGWWIGVVLLGALVISLLLSRSIASRWLVWFAVAAPNAARYRPITTTSRHWFGLVPFLTVSAIFLGLASQRRLLPDELDLVWVMLAVSVMLALFGVGGARRRQRFSLVGLASVWLRQVPIHLALWACVLVTVLEHGRASVWELASPQTLDPRTFGAFVTPSNFLVAASLALTSIALALCNYAPDAGNGSRFWSKVNAMSRAFGDVASLLLGATLVAVYFGGWSLKLDGPGSLSVGEALSFQARFSLFYAGFVVLRRWVPEAPIESLELLGTRCLLPLAVVSLVVLPVWGADVWPVWMRTATKTLLLSVTALLIAGVPAVMVAMRRMAGAKLRASGLNPWI
jgi:NADH:ubiquinone oxidoreductase subunit H